MVETLVRPKSVDSAMDNEADTATDALGTATEPLVVPAAQRQQTVDIMKVGGAVLGIENDDEELVGQQEEMFDAIGEEVSRDKNDIVLVSSFAIGMGMLADGESVRPEAMEELQAYASEGQPLLHARWAQSITKKTGQLLLADDEIKPEGAREPQDSQLKLKETLSTIHTLLARGRVPIVNENDAITHKEITFGSNDVLAATLAAAMQRSRRFGQVRFFMLTDVNGVYADKDNPNTRIPVIERIHKYRHLAHGSDSKNNIGGMKSKFKAAGIATHADIPTYIYNPADGPRQAAVDGEIGTYFPVWTPHNP